MGEIDAWAASGASSNECIYQNGKLMSLEANVRDYQKILEQQI